MRHDLIDILVCPLCKNQLQLTVQKEADAEVLDGNLHCTPCNED